ncbi:helix-turn-helix transcriptional regulator [Paenibacillus sp. 19GGS1-52]|uniref:helix-turn-helix transcriptional regulator n=1 Tax=Paenibacillus sp. 19GGS1-52 TaxID=2758563 RepID=UPI001EFBC323|nr:helix-turn-helix transcriptional regulator [Paenibacillus sp. 19GGS1-52]ULO08907.1 helix-turn-helix transcriptional regulator [Paenibacillus sp. 19GGS1-52]
MSKVLGNNIATIRKELKITQQDLADSIGMERTSLSQIETGAYNPSADTMKKISDALMRPLGDIFFNPDVLKFETKLIPLRVKHSFANEVI